MSESSSRIGRPLALLGLSLLSWELVSWAGVAAVARARPELLRETFIEHHFAKIDTAWRDRFLEEAWDAELGWDNHPNTSRAFTNSRGDPWEMSFGSDGAREDSSPHTAIAMNAYGDSFTRCDEVQNDETWPALLEGGLGADVKNFGVGGYGIGQALRKLERHLAEGRTAPITLLAVYEDDLGRDLASFRPFQSKDTGAWLGFKPSLRQRDGKIVAEASAYDDASLRLEELERRAQTLARDDFWIAHRFFLDRRFPHAWQSVRIAGEIARRIACRLQNRRCAPNVWATAEGGAVFEHLLNRFVAVTREHGSEPVLMLIPALDEPGASGGAPAYADLVEQVIRRRFPELPVIDIADLDPVPGVFTMTRDGGHASPEGNRRIAQAVLAAAGPLLGAVAERGAIMPDEGGFPQ